MPDALKADLAKAAAEITSLREALAQSPEDAEFLCSEASALRAGGLDHIADRLEAIANRLSGVRE